MISTVEYWSIEDDQPVLKDIYRVDPMNLDEFYIEHSDLGKHWVDLLLKMHQHYINSEIYEFVATSKAVEYGKPAVLKTLLKNNWVWADLIEEYRVPDLYDYAFKHWYDEKYPAPQRTNTWGFNEPVERFFKAGE